MTSGNTTTPERRLGSVELLGAGLVVAVLLRQQVTAHEVDHPGFQTWATVFVSVCVQALPFLVLGVALSAALTAFVPAEAIRRALPRTAARAVPVAGAAGAILPGCECASVPLAGSLISRGVPAPAALAFLLAAPAINPVVVVATVVAFPGHPEVALARFVASLLTAMVMGWLWAGFGRTSWLRTPRLHTVEGGGPWETFRRSAQHDLLQAGGFLVVGGLSAATLNQLVPRGLLDSVAGSAVGAVLALACLAVVLAICSEADAFVAASLSQFSLTARLAFLVVGPMVDVKLVALQTGTFGRAFAVRFAPLTFLVAVGVAASTAAVLL